MNKIFEKLNYLFRKKEKQPAKIKVCWDFLALIMNRFYLTDDEITEFMEIDDHNPDILLEIIREYLVPDYHCLSSKSKEKIKNTLTYYLATDSEKLEWPFASYYIPLDDAIAKLFYTLVWRELYGTDFPEPINPDDYEEDCSSEYIMSIYDADPEEDINSPCPVRKEISFTDFMKRLKQIQTWKTNS